DVDDGAPNLAVGQQAYASSVYQFYSARLEPNFAVDGVTQYFNDLSTTNPQIFHSAYSDQAPWFSVDLGFSASIVRVVIWNRCDCCEGRMQNAELRIGDVAIAASGDTAKITSNPLVWTQTSNLGLCAAMAITFDTPQVGRWVTLQNKNLESDDGMLQLTELQAFGFGLDYCSQLPCGEATCTNLDTTWMCGTCPPYTYSTTTAVRGAKGPACRGMCVGLRAHFTGILP
ncbi:hypothetical protein PLESTF_000999600, partial [Pleodorina starrii]